MHEMAARGFAKDALKYVRGRPEYPEGVDEWLRDSLHLGDQRTVVELGAGTGKFTRSLAGTGAHVIAVEPVPQMLAQLTQALPSVEAKPGTAEAIPIEDESADAVVCAQAFHWFANEATLREVRRVLRPGGLLGLVWNVLDDSVDWTAAMTAVIAPYQGDLPRYTSGAWRRVFPAEGFGPLREVRFRNGHRGPPERVIVDRVLSTSFIAALDPPRQMLVADRLRELIATHPALAGQAQVTVPYQTFAFSCERTD